MPKLKSYDNLTDAQEGWIQENVLMPQMLRNIIDDVKRVTREAKELKARAAELKRERLEKKKLALEGEPKIRQSKKSKMISDIDSILNEHKKVTKHRMIKDLEDLLKSINTTKPKIRKSLDKSIKANDLIHKIEGKLKKKKAIKMSLDKFF